MGTTFDTPNVPAAAGGGGAVTSAVANLAANFPLNVDTAYHDVTGVSLALPAGTYNLICTAEITLPGNGAANPHVFLQLLAGATVIASMACTDAGGGAVPITFPAMMVAVNVAGGQTVKLQARTSDAADGDVIVAIADGQAAGGNATRLVSMKVG